jgi:hypothetical protein
VYVCVYTVLDAADQQHIESLSKRPYWTSYLLGVGVGTLLHIMELHTTFHQQKNRLWVVYNVSKSAGLQ